MRNAKLFAMAIVLMASLFLACRTQRNGHSSFNPTARIISGDHSLKLYLYKEAIESSVGSNDHSLEIYIMNVFGRV